MIIIILDNHAISNDRENDDRHQNNSCQKPKSKPKSMYEKNNSNKNYDDSPKFIKKYSKIVFLIH